MDRWNINLYTNQIQNKFEFTLVYSSVFLFVVVAIIQLLSRVPLFETPWTVAHQVPLPMEFSRQEYWSGLPCPSPGIFLTHRLNPGLLHCRQILYHLSYQGSPQRILEWVALPSSRGSFQPRDRTHVSYVSCIGWWVLYH